MSKKVWLSPNVASSDLLRMFQQPGEWEEARRYIGVLSLVQWSITNTPSPKSGPNNAASFLACVPGGAFLWLVENGIELSIEASAVKEWSCRDERHQTVEASVETLSIIEGSGGRVDYIVMDEPFVAGLAPAPSGCGYSVEECAHETKLYIDAVHAQFPHVQIGLVEAYPAHQDDEIVRFVTALQDAGCALPFVHVDLDLYRVRREHREKEAKADLKRIQSFCASQGIRYGAVVWGERGTSNAEFCKDARDLAQLIHEAIGFGTQDDLVFQSWSADGANMQGLQRLPDNLPGSSPISHTGLLTSTLQKYGVESPKEEH